LLHTGRTASNMATMRNIPKWVVVCAASWMLAVPTTSSADAIDNAEFEAGSLTGWLTFGDVGVDTYDDTAPFDPYDWGTTTIGSPVPASTTYHGWMATKGDTATAAEVNTAFHFDGVTTDFSTLVTGSSTGVGEASGIYQFYDHTSGTADTITYNMRIFTENLSASDGTEQFFWALVIDVDADGDFVVDVGSWVSVATFTISVDTLFTSSMTSSSVGEWAFRNTGVTSFSLSSVIFATSHTGKYLLAYGVSSSGTLDTDKDVGAMVDHYSPAAVPEPSTLVLASGCVGLMAYRRRRAQRAGAAAA